MGGGVKTGIDVQEIERSHGGRSELLQTGVLEHQLKTDAMVVHGWATTLDEGWDTLTDEQKRDAVRVIRRRSAAIAEMARRGLTGVAQSWPGAAPVTTRSDRRHDLAERVREITREMAGSALDHVVRYDGPTSLRVTPAVDIDAVERAVQQLIENAAKYSVAGSEIVVTVRDAASRVAIEVTDEGIGIPAGSDDLFDPFVRHDRTARADGSGLGLFMVRSAIEASGGRVSARRNQRWGSTFHIDLPTS